MSVTSRELNIIRNFRIKPNDRMANFTLQKRGLCDMYFTVYVGSYVQCFRKQQELIQHK